MKKLDQENHQQTQSIQSTASSTKRLHAEVHVDTRTLEEYEADELRLVEQMKEELAQEALKVAEELNYDELPNPFDADWESAPDDVKQRYYDALSKESYAEWCRKNPLPKKDRKYIIDKLIPSYQCHVVCGESGAQKTSILLTLLDDWMLGKDVLGRGSFPVPMLYIAYDRGREATEETFETLGLDHRVFGYVEVTSEDRKLDVAEFIAKLKKENPSVDLFVIDGMFLMAPDVLKVKTKKGDRELRDPYKVHGACHRRCRGHGSALHRQSSQGWSIDERGAGQEHKIRPQEGSKETVIGKMIGKTRESDFSL